MRTSRPLGTSFDSVEGVQEDNFIFRLSCLLGRDKGLNFVRGSEQVLCLQCSIDSGPHWGLLESQSAQSALIFVGSSSPETRTTLPEQSQAFIRCPTRSTGVRRVHEGLGVGSSSTSDLSGRP